MIKYIPSLIILICFASCISNNTSDNHNPENQTITNNKAAVWPQDSMSYKKYQSFDLISLSGVGEIVHQPFVYVKEGQDTITVRISTNSDNPYIFARNKNCWYISRKLDHSLINITDIIENDTVYEYVQDNRWSITFNTISVYADNRITSCDLADSLPSSLSIMDLLDHIKELYNECKSKNSYYDMEIIETHYGKVLYSPKLKMGYKIYDWPLGIFDDVLYCKQILFLEHNEFIGTKDHLQRNPDWEPSVLESIYPLAFQRKYYFDIDSLQN